MVSTKQKLVIRWLFNVFKKFQTAKELRNVNLQIINSANLPLSCIPKNYFRLSKRSFSSESPLIQIQIILTKSLNVYVIVRAGVDLKKIQFWTA